MGDLIFELAEWLRSSALVDWAVAILDWPLNAWMISHFWVIPVLQVVHILAIAVAFGSALMMSLQILGFAGKGMRIADMQARYGRWMWWGGLALLLSGGLLIIAEPLRQLLNPIFWSKMILITVLIAATLACQRAWRAKAEPIGGLPRKLAAWALLLLWLLIMTAGRWIAYAPI